MENKSQEYRFGDRPIIGVDHGFGNMKTRNTVFRTGVKAFKDAPTFGTDILEYGGMCYLIGEGHKPFAADKVADQDYYILTLAAVAKELKARGQREADIILAAGLPIMWVSSQKEDFRRYLLQQEDVDFKYRDIQYHIHFSDVRIYPQGFAAVAHNLSGYDGINVLADIGNGTMNTLYINNHKPQADKFCTDKLGGSSVSTRLRTGCLLPAGLRCMRAR